MVRTASSPGGPSTGLAAAWSAPAALMAVATAVIATIAPTGGRAPAIWCGVVATAMVALVSAVAARRGRDVAALRAEYAAREAALLQDLRRQEVATIRLAEQHLPAAVARLQEGEFAEDVLLSVSAQDEALSPETQAAHQALLRSVVEAVQAEESMRDSAQRGSSTSPAGSRPSSTNRRTELREMEDRHGRNPEVFARPAAPRPRHRADRPARRLHLRARRRPPRPPVAQGRCRCTACCAAPCPGSSTTSGWSCTPSPRSPSSAPPSSRSSTPWPNCWTTPPATRRRRPGCISPRSRCSPASPSRSRTAASASARRPRRGPRACWSRHGPASTSNDLGETPRLGLAVVGRLAQAYDSRSRCAPSAYGGVRAVLDRAEDVMLTTAPATGARTASAPRPRPSRRTRRPPTSGAPYPRRHRQRFAPRSGRPRTRTGTPARQWTRTRPAAAPPPVRADRHTEDEAPAEAERTASGLPAAAPPSSGDRGPRRPPSRPRPCRDRRRPRRGPAPASGWHEFQSGLSADTPRSAPSRANVTTSDKGE